MNGQRQVTTFPNSISWQLLIALLCSGFTIGLGYFVQQADFQIILSLYIPFFLIYCLLLRSELNHQSLLFFIGLAIFLRCLLVFSMPNLSDDIYRFIWDGRLLLDGISPFDALPSYYMEPGNERSLLNPELFRQLNSPDYFTIYPPVCQGIFAGACWLAPQSVYWSAVLMKVSMLFFEVGSIYLIYSLLQQFHLSLSNVLIYAINPLILIEIMGNLHFEGAMIFFLLLAIWWLNKGKMNRSALAFALSIASKLLPLMFLPLLIKRLGWRKSIRYFLVIGTTLALLFSPLLSSTFFHNFGSSLDLYFQKFEFNASIYYLLRWLLYQITGYNQIAILGPLLGLIVLGAILWKARQKPLPALPNLLLTMLFAISLYLFCATTVHPWYVGLPLVLCLFTPFRFPVLWSGLIILTYINYSYPTYFENLWLVGIEYGMVFGFLWWELANRKHLPKEVNASI